MRRGLEQLPSLDSANSSGVAVRLRFEGVRCAWLSSSKLIHHLLLPLLLSLFHFYFLLFLLLFFFPMLRSPTQALGRGKCRLSVERRIALPRLRLRVLLRLMGRSRRRRLAVIAIGLPLPLLLLQTQTREHAVLLFGKANFVLKKPIINCSIFSPG